MSISDWAGVMGVIIGIAGLLGGLMGWLLRQLWDAVKELTKQVGDLEHALPGTYIRRDEMTLLRNEIIAEVRNIEFKLDRHMENSTQLWVNSQRNPLPPEHG